MNNRPNQWCKNLLFVSLSAGVLANLDLALADTNLDMQAVILRASDDVVFGVRAIPEGSFNGLGRDVVLKNVETIIYNTTAADDIEVVFVNDCRNYNGIAFTAYLSCPAQFDAVHKRSVASLDLNSCRSDERTEHTNYNFNFKGGWYVSGRSGYYSAQICTPRVAVRKNSAWLVDPVTNSNNFGVMFDYRKACPQGC